MLLSIIIPTYNRANILPNTIRSVLAQTYGNWELILVDDKSTDNTEEVIKSFTDKRIKYVQNQKKGAPSARNTGLRMSNGDLILFLDSDDTIDVEMFKTHVEVHKKDPQIDVSVNKVVRVNISSGSRKNIDNIEPKNNLQLEFISKDVVWKMHSAIWNAQFIKQNNLLFEEELTNSQDYQFYSYCVLNNPNVQYIDEFFSIINDYDSSEDPSKIRGQNNLKSLKNHIKSRFMVYEYAKIKIDKVECRGLLGDIRKYIKRHRRSCYRQALLISPITMLRLLVYRIKLG